MQLSLEIQTIDISILPASMVGASNWSGMCSWCGVRPNQDIDEANHAKGYESIAWALEVTIERICPFCIVKPTPVERAIEVARELVRLG